MKRPYEKHGLSAHLMLTTAYSKRGPMGHMFDNVIIHTEAATNLSQSSLKRTLWTPDQDGPRMPEFPSRHRMHSCTWSNSPKRNLETSRELLHMVAGGGKCTERVGKAETTSHYKQHPIKSGWNPTLSFSWEKLGPHYKCPQHHCPPQHGSQKTQIILD